MKKRTILAIVTAILAFLSSCQSLDKQRVLAFTPEPRFTGMVFISPIEVVKDSRADAIHAEAERLASSILWDAGFALAENASGADYVVSAILTEREFVRGMYRPRSVLVELRMSRAADGTTVALVRLERETDSTLESSYFLDETLTAAFDALFSQVATSATIGSR